MLKIEADKEYRIWFKDFDNMWCLLINLEPNSISSLYPRTKNFRYTHYINYLGSNLNQLSADYINDAIKFGQAIPIWDGKGGVVYKEIVDIKEICK